MKSITTENRNMTVKLTVSDSKTRNLLFIKYEIDRHNQSFWLVTIRTRATSLIVHSKMVL